MNNEHVMFGRKTKWAYELRMMAALTALCLLTVVASAAAPTSSSSSASTNTQATNMVVDFTSIPTDFSAKPGDSVVFNLVIKNTGGQKAENVQLWLQSTATVRSDKRFYVGDMDAGESKTMPVIIAVSPTANAGLSAIQVKINFDGYKSDGSSNVNQFTTWEIPLTILANPLFEITPVKTTYYRDTLDDLVLEFNMNGSEVNGTCGRRQAGQLSCFPQNRAFMQEAASACSGKSENASCELKMNDNVINGTCGTRGAQGLRCVPNGMGQRMRNGTQQWQRQGQRQPPQQGMPEGNADSAGGN